MKSLRFKIVEVLINEKIISESDKDVYLFGLEQGTILIKNILTMIIIGLLFNTLLQLAIFTVGYMVLRQYAGGYHAETERKCYLYSTLLTLVVSLIFKYYDLGIVNNLILLVVSISVISVLGPVEDHHKPLDEMEIKVYGKKMKQIIVGELFIIIALFVGNYNFIAESIVLSIVSIGCIVVIGWLKNQMMIRVK